MTELNKITVWDISTTIDNDIIVSCPHCKDYILVEKLNCHIFRHGIFINNGEQISPHSTKEMCDYFVSNNMIYGCDHGVPFHEDFKLRTVLWQFADLPLSRTEESALSSFQVDLDTLLTQTELRALNQRIEDMLQNKRFPLPPTDWPAIPWPPF